MILELDEEDLSDE
jgi:hypothetical protein